MSDITPADALRELGDDQAEYAAAAAKKAGEPTWSGLFGAGGPDFDLDPDDTEGRKKIAELEAEVERLHSWGGLISLLDEHWPEEAFPTLEDDAARDTGPRLVAALRRAKEATDRIHRVRDLAAEWDRQAATACDGSDHSGCPDCHMDAYAQELRDALDGPDYIDAEESP